MAALPYNPMRILSSPALNGTFYILQPGSNSSQLLALNTTGTLDPINLPYSTITPSVPFLDGGQGGAYTSAIDQEGNILVHAGNCTSKAQGSRLWRFTPADDKTSVNGTWKDEGLNFKGLDSNDGLNGANYLAGAIAFSSTPNANPEMFIFGGMCPTSTSSTENNWTHIANYSNTMLTIESSQGAISSFDLGISPSRGPPVAEAGFSITPLQPTFFDSGTINGSQSQNQNFVLIGGHTQHAFINMSQVALFSLPEQSWTFVPIDLPTSDPNTELTVRDQTSVDSRSGHTALLSPDGKSVVIFGGWVGDIYTPADPQLAVLKLGEGYGGSGDWQWSVPSPTGPGLTPGSGLYGHGAVMLAGDVMMAIGGYQISASTISKRKRSDPLVSTNTYFLNTTSNTWISSYTHPVISTSHGSVNGSIAKAAASEKRVGLGVGLTLGVLGILAVVIFYFWYSRRLKRRRDARENELRHLTAGPRPFHTSSRTSNGLDRRPSEMSTVDWGRDDHLMTRGNELYSSGRSEPEAERTGLLFEIPSPTRGLRRSLHSRGTYQPTSRFDDGRRGPGFSTIHPIDEREEYDEGHVDGESEGQHEIFQRDDYNILTHVPVLDPFRDPMGGSRTPSPQSPQERELEVRNWVSDWTAADAMMHSHAGRLSPDKTDRTSSTLSDQSARSGFSSHSIQRSVGTISRSISQRSAALLSGAPFRSTTPIDFQHNTPQRYSPEHRRARSLTLNPSAQRTITSDNYGTVATSFPHLQSEGEALLGDYPDSGEPSPTRTRSRRKGWMGSVRRAFTGIERSASVSPDKHDSASSSPTKPHYTDGGLPRRAASTGGMLWQKRQGARDWDVGGKEEGNGRNDIGAQEENDEEWDVESAVERRVVQVMFTVPKEKLRVVNRGPDGDGESLMSTEVKDAGDGSDERSKGKGKEEEK